MNIGFANIYSYRPHVEHLYFLAKLAQAGGAIPYALTCDGSTSACYTKLLKQKGCISECSKCVVGGVRSYPFKHVSRIKDRASSQNLSDDELNFHLTSSAATLTRIACQRELADTELLAIREQLRVNARATFHSTIRWIEQQKLDAVICFNGRMDMTRMITLACERLGIPYITHERTWFGHGIQLIPNGNCLALNPINQLVSAFEDKPLQMSQVALAGDLIARRFLKTNHLEWRVYNQSATKSSWPIHGNNEKVLLLPSSWNEFATHPDWETEWADPLDALDAFFEAYSLKPEQVVLRCHPNWSEKIGQITGKRMETHYMQWAKKRGIHCIGPGEKVDTYDLIQDADTVLLNGGSSAIEAAACGKKVFNLGHMTYEAAEFCHGMTRYADMESAIAASNSMTTVERHRSNLRYIYTHAARYPQFTKNVRAISTTEYAYHDGANPEQLLDIFKYQQLKADDGNYSQSTEFEDNIIDKLTTRSWQDLITTAPKIESNIRSDIKRKIGMRWVDRVRKMMPLGDR